MYLNQLKSQQTQTDRSLNSNHFLTVELVRLLSAKDPMAYAQISEVGQATASGVVPAPEPDMSEQFKSEAEQTKEWMQANGIKGWEEMTDNERDFFNEVADGEF